MLLALFSTVFGYSLSVVGNWYGGKNITIFYFDIAIKGLISEAQISEGSAFEIDENDFKGV